MRKLFSGNVLEEMQSFQNKINAKTTGILIAFLRNKLALFRN